MENEDNSVMAPIKGMITVSMEMNNSVYPDDVVMLLMAFFIACLNLNYIKLSDLEIYVNRMTSTVHNIVFVDSKFLEVAAKNKDVFFEYECDKYLILNDTLFLDLDMTSSDEKYNEYIINIFKAFSHVVLNISDRHPALGNAVTEMIAEKVNTMHRKNRSFIRPETVQEDINNTTLTLRVGYIRYTLIIQLLKQIFTCFEIDECSFFRDLFKNGYEKELNKLKQNYCVCSLKEAHIELDEILTKLDKIYSNYIVRTVKGQSIVDEISYINQFQEEMSMFFDRPDERSRYFAVLLTSDEQRRAFMKRIQKNKHNNE